MGEVEEISTKNFKDFESDLKCFESNLLKIDKKHCKGINIYYIGCITIKSIDVCKSIYSVNPLYLQINHANRHIEEKNENKYLNFDSTDEKELLKKEMFGMELKTRLR